MAIRITDYRWIWDKTRNMILTPQSRRLDSSPILLRNTEEQKVTFSAPANVVR